jgi:hypothetical protein
MNFDKHIHFCDLNPYQDMECYHHPRKFLHAFQSPSLHILPPTGSLLQAYALLCYLCIEGLWQPCIEQVYQSHIATAQMIISIF